MKQLITLTVATLLFGCTPEYHLRKFKAKGGEIVPEIKVVEVAEALKVNGKDSVILMKYPVTCGEIKLPEPKWKTKLLIKYKDREDKRENDLKEKEIKYKYKTVRVKEKAHEKPSNWYWWLIAGYVLNFIIRNAYFYFRK